MRHKPKDIRAQVLQHNDSILGSCSAAFDANVALISHGTREHLDIIVHAEVDTFEEKISACGADKHEA